MKISVLIPPIVAGLMPVGASLCMAAGEPATAKKAERGSLERIIKKEVTVSAPIDDVWRAWTTSEGVTSFGPPAAKIELRVGGAYEWYFMPDQPPGARGSDGCRVLSYLPMRMLSFEWNAPPSIPKLRESDAKTHVIIEFEEVEAGQVTVTLSQLGLGQGEEWDKYYEYFDAAWGRVLDGLVKHFQRGGKEASKPGAKQHWVYFIRPVRPSFFDKATPEEERIVSEHARYIQGLLATGTLVLAGPCFDPPYYPEHSDDTVSLEMPTPGIVVFEADGLDAARKIMEGDPAVKAGVFKARLNTFNLAFQRKE